MSSISIVGGAVVITSSIKNGEIKMLEKYRPEALTLMDDDNKEPIFVIATSKGVGNIGKYGVEFAADEGEDDQQATVTIVKGGNPETIKEFVVEELGEAISKLNALEQMLPDTISQIKEEHRKIVDSIRVIQ